MKKKKTLNYFREKLIIATHNPKFLWAMKMLNKLKNKFCKKEMIFWTKKDVNLIIVAKADFAQIYMK